MVDHKLNGVLDARDKISRYGLSRSLAKEEKYDFYEELLQPSQLEVSWGTRKLKVCMYETMIIMGGMTATTRMKITIRGMVTMMKALDSIQNLTFQNSME